MIESAASALATGRAGDSAPPRLVLDPDAIAAFCRRHHIRRLALFGSVLRDDFGPQSDIDVLVEFAPGHVPGLAFFAMQEELGRLVGRPVDLNTPACLSPYFRDAVAREAATLYDAP
jgi:predicted nucleotidyltransferase